MDSIDYADPTVLGGLNLYAYCNNNPVMYIDPSGHVVLGLILSIALLATGLVAGGVISGVTAYNNGARGWDVFKAVVIGAAIGLAAAGAAVSLVGAGLGALSVSTFLGMQVSQMVAIGALAFDTVAFVVAPILGITMQPIEFGVNKPDIPMFSPPITYTSIDKFNNWN